MKTGLKLFLAVLLNVVIFQTAHSTVNYITTKARYKAKEGKMATITYKGKDLKIPVSRIQDPNAVTGTDVTVTLYPREIGIPQ